MRHWLLPSTATCSLALLLLPCRALGGAQAQSGDGAASLECRIGSGAWRPCQMELEEPGLSWRLRLEGELIRFRHDGRGDVRMQRGAGGWMPVQPHWNAEAALCWDGICARGDLPLD